MKLPDKLVQTQLPNSQYYRTKHPKKQIVIHHTVSNGNANNVIAWWKKTPQRVGTAFIIDREGIIHQCFQSGYWAHHLGLKDKRNLKLNQQSIGIELCNWGGLHKVDGKFTSYFNAIVPCNEVITYEDKFRGYSHFQKYTEVQLESLSNLIQYLGKSYDIPLAYNPCMWDLSQCALHSVPGVFTHVTFRDSKSDCHPQPELIQTLKSLP